MVRKLSLDMLTVEIQCLQRAGQDDGAALEGGSMKRCRVSVLVLTGMVMASPAQADWQYTKWGMSAQEVAAASDGQATVSTGNEGQRIEGYEIGDIGTYNAGGHHLSAVFYFTGGKLSLVQISATEGCPSILNQVRAAYGEPNFDNRSPIVRQITWKDDQGGNTVSFDGLSADSCSISYKPLRENNGF